METDKIEELQARIATLEAAMTVEQRVYALCYEALGGPMPPVGPPLHVKIRLMREALEKADAVNKWARNNGWATRPMTECDEYEAARAKTRTP